MSVEAILSAYMLTHTHVCTHTHIRIHQHTLTHTHSHTPIHPYTHACIHQHTNPHPHTHVHPYTLTYMNTPSHTHTPPHTYTCTACFSISHIHTHSILFCVLILFQNASSQICFRFLYIHIYIYNIFCLLPEQARQHRHPERRWCVPRSAWSARTSCRFPQAAHCLRLCNRKHKGSRPWQRTTSVRSRACSSREE